MLKFEDHEQPVAKRLIKAITSRGALSQSMPVVVGIVKEWDQESSPTNTYHVRFRLQAHAGAEDVGQRTALLGESIDNGRTGRCQRSFEHVAEDGKHAVEALVLLLALALPLDARHHFSDKHKIDDERRGQEGVLADVEDPVQIHGEFSGSMAYVISYLGTITAETVTRDRTYEIVWWPPMKISA